MGPKEGNRRISRIASTSGGILLAASSVAGWNCAQEGNNTLADASTRESARTVSGVSLDATNTVTLAPEPTPAIATPEPTLAVIQETDDVEADPMVSVGQWVIQLEGIERPDRRSTSSVDGVPYQPVLVKGALFNAGQEGIYSLKLYGTQDKDFNLKLGKVGASYLNSSSKEMELAVRSPYYGVAVNRYFYMPPQFGLPYEINYEVENRDGELELLVNAGDTVFPDENTLRIEEDSAQKVDSYVGSEAVVYDHTVPWVTDEWQLSYGGVEFKQGREAALQIMNFSFTNRSGREMFNVQDRVTALVYLPDNETVLYGDLQYIKDQVFSASNDLVQPGETKSLPVLIGQDPYDNAAIPPNTAEEDMPRTYDLSGAIVVLTINEKMFGAWQLPETPQTAESFE